MPENIENLTPPQERETKLENINTAYAISLLQNFALEKMEEAATADGRSIADLLRQLDEARRTQNYDARYAVTEVLRQRLDIADIRGAQRSQEILNALKNVYAADEYSKMYQNILLAEMPKDDADVLIHVLLDKKFSNSTHILYSLKNNEVREKIYQALKSNNAADKSATLVSTTEDLPTKTRLFEDITAWLAQNSSEEAKKVMDSYGEYNRLKRDIAVELFNRDTETFGRFLERGMIDIDGLEDTIKDESDETLANILPHVITADDAARVIKFIRDKDALLAASRELSLSALPPESRAVVAENTRRLADAFDASPNILSLGYLRERGENAKSYDILNKFIIALRNGEHRATIAWSNTQDFFEHKLLAQHIGKIPKALCAGGEIQLIRLENKKLQAVFQGRSGTFGPYNQIFLERFGQAIAEHLRRDLNADVEVVIHPSEI